MKRPLQKMKTGDFITHSGPAGKIGWIVYIDDKIIRYWTYSSYCDGDEDIREITIEEAIECGWEGGRDSPIPTTNMTNLNKRIRELETDLWKGMAHTVSDKIIEPMTLSKLERIKCLFHIATEEEGKQETLKAIAMLANQIDLVLYERHGIYFMSKKADDSIK